MECNAVLTEWELEQQAKHIEAITAGAFGQVVGGGHSGPVDRSGPVTLDA